MLNKRRVHCWGLSKDLAVRAHNVCSNLYFMSQFYTLTNMPYDCFDTPPDLQRTVQALLLRRKIKKD